MVTSFILLYTLDIMLKIPSANLFAIFCKSFNNENLALRETGLTLFRIFQVYLRISVMSQDFKKLACLTTKENIFI